MLNNIFNLIPYVCLVNFYFQSLFVHPLMTELHYYYYWKNFINPWNFISSYFFLFSLISKRSIFVYYLISLEQTIRALNSRWYRNQWEPIINISILQVIILVVRFPLVNSYINLSEHSVIFPSLLISSQHSTFNSLCSKWMPFEIKALPSSEFLDC